MPENIEIKATCSDLQSAIKKAQKIASKDLGTDIQTDTYFTVQKGRLKLRESKLDGAFLIPYLRADHSGPKSSQFSRIRIENPSMVKDLFSKILGIHAVVKKRRQIFLYENIRIHLDEVDHLGDFVELEAVLDPQKSNTDVETEKVARLMNIFGVKRENLVAESYENLIRNAEQERG